MKRSIIATIITLCGMCVSAQNYHATGEQFGEWDYDTVFIDKDITVPSGENLNIAAGTKVVFTGHYRLDVKGGINAAGSLSDSIFFTVADTTGFYNDTIAKGGWNAITFNDNDGAAIFNYCHFSYGKAFTTFEKDICGGAIRVIKSNGIDIQHCTFIKNKAYLKGGAISAQEAKIKMSDCDVIGNSVADVYTPTFQYGGGCFFRGCEVIISKLNALRNISAKCYGSGACLDSCSFSIVNSFFNGNQGALAGGLGIIRCNYSDNTIANTVISNNGAMFFGGGMTSSISRQTLNNVDIINNVCDMGGGIQMVEGASTVFNNCIFYGNGGTFTDTLTYGSQVWVTSETCFSSFRYCYVEGGSKLFQMPELGTYIYEDNMEDGDPQFVDIENNNFRLAENSPLRDAGFSDTAGLSLPDYDLDMNRRISNGRIDIGAYEYSGTDISENNHNNLTFSIMPNPVDENSVCRFSLEQENIVMMRVIDEKGLVVGFGKFDMNKGEQSIRLKDLMRVEWGEGRFYFIEMIIGGEKCCKKIMIDE